LEFTNQVAEVSGFANLLNPLRDIPIIKAALAYDHLDTGETIVLVINQALYFGDQLDDILIKPNQLRAFGNIVDGIPKHLGGSIHLITIPEDSLTIHLKLKGVISYFPV
jgi:hypothetical protein